MPEIISNIFFNLWLNLVNSNTSNLATTIKYNCMHAKMFKLKESLKPLQAFYFYIFFTLHKSIYVVSEAWRIINKRYYRINKRYYRINIYKISDLELSLLILISFTYQFKPHYKITRHWIFPLPILIGFRYILVPVENS